MGISNALNSNRFACALLGCAWLGMFSGCGSETERSQASREQANAVELVYWTAPNPQEVRFAEEVVRKWHEQRPGIRIRIQPLPAGQSSEEVLMSAIAAGTTPDLCSNIWPGVVPDFVRARSLLPLDTMQGYAEIKDRVPESILEEATHSDGHVYQVPWKSNPIMMQYNARLLREVGFDEPPATYSAFMDLAERLHEANATGGQRRWIGYRDIRDIWWQRYFDFYPFYLAASSGQTFFEGDSLVYDAEVGVQVFSFFRELYENGWFPTTSLQGNAFLSGRVATEFTGPWSVSYLERNAPDSLEFDYAPIPVPDGFDGPVHTYGDHKNIVVFATTPHPEAAFEFVRFMIQESQDLTLLEVTKQIPLRKNLLENPAFQPFFEQEPMLATFARQVRHTRSVDQVKGLRLYFDAVSRFHERSSVYGKVDPQEAGHRLGHELQRLASFQ